MSNKISQKADRPGVDRYGRTELHYAALNGDEQKVAELIQAQADVNQRDDDGRTALHFAAQERQSKVVDLLLKHRADPNITDSHDNSPLWTATMNCGRDVDSIHLLLFAGANPIHKNRHGKSPYDAAMSGGVYLIKKAFENSIKNNVSSQFKEAIQKEWKGG